MDTLLMDGDHVLDGRGLPAEIGGDRELVQRALIRLAVKKGAFAPDEALGSELHRLRRAPARSRDRMALSYVQEALAPLRGEGAAVAGVRCETRGADRLAIRVTLSRGEREYELEVAMQL